MTALRLALPLVSLALSCGPAPVGAFADKPERAEEVRLTLTGTLRMPDGSPAPRATVELTDDPDESPIVARTDAAGRFRIRGVFGNGARLHARSADRNHQATRIIPADAVRSMTATPIELTLATAVGHEVVVVADGPPVEGAYVVASGFGFDVYGVTGPDGTVRLRLPAGERLRELVAWHPDRGVRGVRGLDARPAQDRTALSLLPPAPLRIRVVDPEGRPIAGLELGASFSAAGSDWAAVDRIEPARVRTDAEGMATVPWAPREKLKYVDPRTIGPDWKIDGIDLDKLADRIVTIHVRRKVPVEGHLVLPSEMSAEGLLITGHGFGPRDHGDGPNVRARADGSFILRIAPEHGYVLGIVDLEWAADPWSGLILGEAAAKPVPIAMSVYRAAPVTVRVTRGPRRAPVAEAQVDMGSKTHVTWVDAAGKKRNGMAGIGSSLRTDEDGVARAGAARGQYEIRMASGDWNEERTIAVKSDGPIDAVFHRPWVGRRQVAGRLLSDGRPFEPSAALVSRGWSPRDGYRPAEFKPEVKPDGTFQAACDAENLALFFSDPDKRRSGSILFGPEGSSAEVNLVAMATYSGTVLDEDGKPLAGQTLNLHLKTAGPEPIATQQTDPSGRFRFAAVPSMIPVQLSIGGREGRSEYYIAGGDRFFDPGEIRENGEIRAHRRQSPAQVARRSSPPAPLTGRVENTCRNIRGSGMHALLLLQGDESRNVVALGDQLLDYDRSPLILRYLPVRVESKELKPEAETLKKQGWPTPAPGQVVLVALDGDQRTLATTTIAADPPAAAPGLGDAFLKQHSPPPHDARARLTAARDEARNSGRRVWIVIGGPRCGPCFRLGRWIDEHRATLDKDFVIAKVMEGLDEHAGEVVKELPIHDGDGIPWYAITEPDETILTTSRGPLGNMGFPSTIEDLRHLRRMLQTTARKLTAAEIDGLIGSLSPKP